MRKGLLKAALFAGILVWSSLTQIAIAEAQSAPPVTIVPNQAHTSVVNAVAFSNDGRLVVSGGADNLIKLWDVATGRLIRTLAGHGDWINSVSISPDRTQLVSAGRDGTMKLWDIVSGAMIRTFQGITDARGTSAMFIKDGKVVGSVTTFQKAHLWETATGKLIGEIANDTLKAAEFFPDGTRLLQGGWYS